MPKGNQNP